VRPVRASRRFATWKPFCGRRRCGIASAALAHRTGDLDTFGLAERASVPADALSYGEKKRLDLARAFVSNPKLVLLDEPVAGLNPDETERVGR